MHRIITTHFTHRERENLQKNLPEIMGVNADPFHCSAVSPDASFVW